MRGARGWLGVLVGMVLLVGVGVAPAVALDYEVLGNPLRVMGYINQGMSWGIAGDHYDTKEDLQQLVFQLLLEGDYTISNNLRLFGSGMFNADWVYPLFEASDDGEWKDKGFDKSDDELFILDKRDDLLKELHLTWTPGNFYLRAGKQIVVWGETDGFRIMDQINPLDQRRGLTDVEFETTIIPVWLIRAQYFLQPQSSWLQDVGLEVVFNPNLEFRGNEAIVPGNDVAGIWAPDIEIPLGGPYPFDYAHLGSLRAAIDKPDAFDSEGFEYGARLRTVMWDSIVTLNYFYGRDNDFVTKNRALPPDVEISPYDGRMVMHPYVSGKYPLLRFVGGTFTRDFENIRASWLGGVAPVLRLEGFYAFDNTFASNGNEYEHYDEIRWAAGVDWKVKVPFLNPRAYFMISPQIYHRHIVDYSDTWAERPAGLKGDNWQSSLMINTTYFHNKLQPMVFWLYDVTNSASMVKLQLAYEHSHHWNFTLGALLLEGSKEDRGFDPLEHKDQLYFTAAYRF